MLRITERSIIKDHFILLSFIFCCIIFNNPIDTQRGRNQVYLEVINSQNSGRANSTRGKTFCFHLLVSLIISLLRPLYIFAFSCVMSYKVLFFMLVIISDLPLASWLNNNYCKLYLPHVIAQYSTSALRDSIYVYSFIPWVQEVILF